MQVLLHLTPNELAALGYKDLSLISESDNFCIYHALTHDDHAVLIKSPTSAMPPGQLEHELEIACDLNPEFVVRPIKIERSAEHSVLILESCAYPPLTKLLQTPLEVATFLSIAAGITAALSEIHRHGLVHKEIQPDNIFAITTGRVKLTGFGVATRLTQERQPPTPAALIPATLAYMAPEQTGRIDHSIDARSDLYALGVTFYRMLAGRLPFNASDPMEWVHCHIAIQPKPPREHMDTIPEPLSDLVMKLLAKNPEERYQTADGLKADLEHCLQEWHAHGRIEPFTLGTQDVPDRLVIPEKLYGREQEMATLHAAYERVCVGASELLLLAGYAGVGKTSLVHEAFCPALALRGYFIEGKFDELQRAVPYAAWGQAFSRFVNYLLMESEAELAEWRQVILKTVGSNGRVLTEVIPSLELIIGTQPPVLELSGAEAQNRLNYLFLELVQVIAQSGRPLIVFLDDLQWADAASLDLLQTLLRGGVEHILVIAAYRDNEVDALHPLALVLDALRKQSCEISLLCLENLSQETVNEMIADALRCEPAQTVTLSRTVHAKTAGNPFFTIQVFESLAAEKIISYQAAKQNWRWDDTALTRFELAANVVDLMVEKIAKLPPETREVLPQAACIGYRFELRELSLIASQTETSIRKQLQPALAERLIIPFDGGYQFAHDRVRQAAYSLIPKSDRKHVHLDIGRLLLQQLAESNREEQLFTIVDHLNAGADLINGNMEKRMLMRMNLQAGARAKASAAYAAAAHYLQQALGLLSPDSWRSDYGLMLALHKDGAASEYLAGNHQYADALIDTALEHATTVVDKVGIYAIQVVIYTTQNRFDDAITHGLRALALLGAKLPDPSDAAALRDALTRELNNYQDNARQVDLQTLLNAPVMDDTAAKAHMDILMHLSLVAYYANYDLFALLTTRMVNLSIARGNADSSALAYVLMAMVSIARKRDYDSAAELGRLGLSLAEQQWAPALEGKLLMYYANCVDPWFHPVKDGIAIQNRGFRAAVAAGSLNDAINCLWGEVRNMLFGSVPLDETHKQCLDSIAFADKVHDRLMGRIFIYLDRIVRCFRDGADDPAVLSGPEFDEDEFLATFRALGAGVMEAHYHIFKTWTLFAHDRVDEALQYADAIAPLIGSIADQPHVALHFIHHSLLLARRYPDIATEERPGSLATIRRNQETLRLWSQHCPQNFQHLHFLGEAELARLENRMLDAMRLYDDAIASAERNDAFYIGGVAGECAARFWFSREKADFAELYLQKAHSAYTRWQAWGKVRALEAAYPHSFPARSDVYREKASSSTLPITPQLDVKAVIKAQHAISSEIMQEQLAEALLHIVMESGGAQKGYLFVAPDSELLAVTDDDGQIVYQHELSSPTSDVAQSILNYVKRTGTSILLADASRDAGDFANDEYLRHTHSKSVLCLPILLQEKLVGVVYLENNLASGAFTEDNLAVLDTLASQAAISLENARLYSELRKSEAKYQRMFETANEGIWIQDENFRTTFANEHMAEMLGYTAAELMQHRVTDFMFAEDATDHARKMEERSRNISDVYERRMRHRDGSTVWMLISATSIFEEGRFCGSFAMLTDISERKQAEQKLAASEHLFRTLVENSPDHIARYDLDLKRVYINPILEKTFQVPADQALGKTPQIASPLIDPERYMANIREVIESAQERSDEISYRTPQGEIHCASTRFAPEIGLDGKIESVLVISNDITEQKKAELQLINAKQMYQTLVNNLPDCIVRFDANARPLFINSTVEKTFGLKQDGFIEKPLTEFGGPGTDEYNSMLQESIRRVYESGEPEILEAQWQTLRGERTFEISHIPERDNQERILSVLGIARDITAAKEAERKNKEHVHFLQNLDRINRALQVEGDIEQIMSRALEEVLDIFGCDRAFLLYPCDPDAATWSIPIESTRPEFPGAHQQGAQPMTENTSRLLRIMLNSEHTIRMGSGSEYPIPERLREKFHIRALMSTILRPRVDTPWQFGIQQCSYDRIWTNEEARLLEEIGHRLSDGLNDLLVTRNLRESEERFRLVYENSPVPTWEEDFSAVKARLEELQTIYGEDLTTYLIENPKTVRECTALVRVIDVNDAALDLHEADSKEALYEGLPKTFIPESYAAFRAELIALARGETELMIDSVVQTLTGKRREVSVSFSVCPGYEQSLSKVFVSLYDITQRKQDEESLRLAASVFATSQEGILISDADNNIIDVNPAFSRITGYSRDEAMGKNPRFLSADHQNQVIYKEMWQSINTKGEWQGELWNQRKTGEVFPELLSIVAVKDEHNQLQHYVGAFSDISALKQHEADLDRIAHFDMLTSVPNRRLLRDRLEQAIAHTRRHGKNLAVCYLDLDGFKPINDQFGHEGGDRMLVEIAHRLESMSRGEDTVARLGGDEFVLLWNDIGTESDCMRALERILEKVAEPMLLDGQPVTVSASIGVTLYPEDDVDADSLLRHADHAMYTAKQLGKNRYQLFDARLERQISAQSELLSMIGRGLDKGQFELYYQPKVNYTEGTVVGVEALLRWSDPILGLVGPKEFLSLIENDILAFRMGRWVLEEAVRQAKRWHDIGITLPISVNIFPRHLKYQTFIDDLRNAIESNWPQMPKNRLLMEIVETSELEELGPIEAVIKECLAMGIGFSLDDFGTGYSSLVYLRRLSIEELKIDQAFVRDMLEDENDEAIVIGVISLGQAFGLRVVAEGVESIKHAKHLENLGCSIVQGYGLGRPMPAHEFQKWHAHFLRQRD